MQESVIREVIFGSPIQTKRVGLFALGVTALALAAVALGNRKGIDVAVWLALPLVAQGAVFCLWLLVDRPRLILSLLTVCVSLDVGLLASTALGLALLGVGAGVLLVLFAISHARGFVNDRLSTVHLVMYERLADGPATVPNLCAAVRQECRRVSEPELAAIVNLRIAAGVAGGQIDPVDLEHVNRGSFTEYKLNDIATRSLPFD